MTLVLILASKLEIIDWVTIKTYFLLRTQFGNLDHRYLFNLIASSILSTNIIVFRIKLIGPSLGIRKTKSQKLGF